MQKCLTNAQMRAADSYTIHTLNVPSLELMERAGRAVFEAIKRALIEQKADDVLIVCGGGNNGGDGFVAARLLLEAGVDTQVLCLADQFSPDCGAEKDKFRGEVLRRLPRRRYAVIVDCIFGTGLSRLVEGAERALVDFINDSGAFVLSVDIPSGLNGDNGQVMGVCVHADRTVTIGEYKTGLFLNDGIDMCGEIVRADIGIDSSNADNACAYRAEEEDIRSILPVRKRNSNKGTYGKVSILAGSKMYSGAPLLATMSALKGGAGYTELCVCARLFDAFLGRLPEAILTEMSGKDFLSFEEEGLKKLLKSDCIALGPGCGVSQEIYKIVAWLLRHYEGKLVLDADALNSIACYGAEILKEKTCKVLLTPHIKEFSRLSGLTVAQIQQDPIACAQAFARTYEIDLLLKSSVSILTNGKRVYLNTRGSVCLAKGGSGDVLTGLVSSIAAQGISLSEAALAGSFLMGLSAELCEEESGAYSVTASEVISRLPRAWVGVIGGNQPKMRINKAEMSSKLPDTR